MQFDFSDALFALSNALDCVEHDLLGVSTNHGKRVAAISAGMAKAMDFSDTALLDLMGCAVMHDCALTEYVQTEYNGRFADAAKGELKNFGLHCRIGQKHVRDIPFYGDVDGVVLYHHERADGSGPFGKTAEETPLYARLIHIADVLDTHFDFRYMDAEKQCHLMAYLRDNCNTQFDADCSELFLTVFDYAALERLGSAELEQFLKALAPSKMKTCTPQELMRFASVFATAADYKSHFTQRHSIGVAEKAYAMAQFYQVDAELAAKLYFAGALHDIGKLVVDNNILEKQDSLTAEEYRKVKIHAFETYRILSSIRGLEEITKWASYHHEKLDGSGYPFGLNGGQLGRWERMMACLDIYQALTETRPYKPGLSHKRAIWILTKMAEKGLVDRDITADIGIYFANAGIASPTRTLTE
ncbi:MAG: HD domain-containing phosphohydrolase [Clostridia bacterium]